eukprot:8107605-Karenia_brevis.AAC.1
MTQLLESAPNRNWVDVVTPDITSPIKDRHECKRSMWAEQTGVRLRGKNDAGKDIYICSGQDVVVGPNEFELTDKSVGDQPYWSQMAAAHHKH